MDYLVLLPFIITFLAGIVLYFVPKKFNNVFKIISGLIITYFFFHVFYSFFKTPPNCKINLPLFGGYTLLFGIKTKLASLFILFIGIVSLLIYIYSLKSTHDLKYIKEFYIYYLWSTGFSYIILVTGDLLVILGAWGFLGFTLYKLVNIDRHKGASQAKKVFLLIGATDAIFILDVCILYSLTKTFNIWDMNLSLVGDARTWIFIGFTIAAFAKAGVFPLHTWITETSTVSRPSVMAFLPASLDKIVGLFFFITIVKVFHVVPGSHASVVLGFIGAATILFSAMMYFIQTNLMKLLSYCLISQVGYMVIGIAIGSPIAMLGAVFHIFNHIIYKSCLFMGAGCVYQNSKSFHLDRIGGMAKIMPLTMFSFTIAALSISGIPPFNGFVSKWIIYQGIAKSGVFGWPIFLVVAIFGSALTLAAFIKQLQSIFFQYKSNNLKDKKLSKASLLMSLPTLIFALLCIVIGIAAKPITKWFSNILGTPAIVLPGYWNPIGALIFVLIGIAISGLIYLLVKNKKIREANSFIGAEKLEPHTMSYSGTQFYKSIVKIKVFSIIYRLARRKWFDLYEIIKKLFLYVSHAFSSLHTGILGTYVTWLIIGLVIILFYLIGSVF